MSIHGFLKEQPMARFASDRLGVIEYEEEKVLEFREGILGFPDLHSYVMVDHESGPFIWLQSLEDPGLAFVIIDPWPFFPSYSPDIADEDVEKLGLTEPYNFSVFCIVNVPCAPAEITVNLMGPIVVNLNTRQARQVVVMNIDYTTREALVEDSEART
jgi:flagellar assembly factor FliW